MNFTKVESSNLEAIAYDEATATLGIQFKKGKRFFYGGVSAFVWRDFLAEQSKGGFFARVVKGNKAYPPIEIGHCCDHEGCLEAGTLVGRFNPLIATDCYLCEGHAALPQFDKIAVVAAAFPLRTP